VPIFAKSGVGMYPIVGITSNLPPNERFKKKNMFLLGLWVGNHHPDMNMFLQPFLQHFKRLAESGQIE
jgi:hypothetical protein